MRTITTTMQPDVVLEIEDAEFEQLRAQGLILKEAVYDGPEPRPLIERK